MGISTWTDSQDQVILDGLKSDQTYTQIATSLGVSKAMVSGRLYRLRKLRPDDMPEKKAQFIHTRRAIPRNGPMAGTLTPKMLARKNVRIERSFRRDEKNAADRAVAKPAPEHAPVAFMSLERGHCTWCVKGEASAAMMCCAAPVIDPKKREGDRRSTHCAYHYELSKAPRK